MNAINYEERTRIYTDALNTFGPTNQLTVALEELSEAQKEICKTLRGNANLLHLAEEIADATIMMEQVCRIFRIEDEVCKIMDDKVRRLEERIQQELTEQQVARL